MSTNGGCGGVKAAEPAEHQAKAPPADRASQQPTETARRAVLQAQALLVGLTGCPPIAQPRPSVASPRPSTSLLPPSPSD